ncbi:MAG: aminotransferase class I/II-fold pyridoxal phosphate-dependent enzyme [Synergistaceae bacterium]|nr:aminotransferase class I/II-fold pyridoxal phosphate-dependent enzyme [Synergistaceae bacterium]
MKKTVKNDTSDAYYLRLARPHILSLEPYSQSMPSALYEDADAVRISANENGFGAPPAVIEALRTRFAGGAGINRYPDITCALVRKALAEKYRLPADWFLVGNGLDDIITMLALSFLSQDDSVIVPSATFSVYANTSRMMGAEPIAIPMKPDLSIDTDAIPDAMKSDTKMIFLCSPNNPTGTVITHAEFDSLLEKLAHMPKQPMIIVDHAYLDFAPKSGDGQNPLDAIKYIKSFNNIAVLRTFSKLSGLAGLRAGYITARPAMLSYMYRIRPPYTVNALAQEAAYTDITDASVREFKKTARKKIMAGKARLEKFFKDLGIAYVPSQANFVFAFYDKPFEKLTYIASELAKRGIFVRTLRHVGAPSGLRFSVGTRDENERLISSLRDILSSGV